MNVNNEEVGTEKSAVTEQPNRQQQRVIDRINKEAAETFGSLAERFFDEFMTTDPEGEAIKEHGKKLDHQWRVYCNRRRLSEEAKTQFTGYYQGVLKEYTDSKASENGDQAPN